MNTRDQTVQENLGLVHSCCKKFRGRGIEYDDLFSAGCLGLIKAVNNFNPDLGLQLSTYAVPVILGEIKRLFRDGGTIKVSRSVRELGLKISRAKEHFTLMQGREPTVSELADLTCSTPEDVAEECNISLSHLQHLFIKLTCEGIATTIRRKRIERACELLISTHRSVRDIALSCGFYDTNYFSVVFKRIRGMTPLEFRKRKGQN
jgi:RNA polymerase sigma factor (sigma-70 family)